MIILPQAPLTQDWAVWQKALDETARPEVRVYWLWLLCSRFLSPTPGKNTFLEFAYKTDTSAQGFQYFLSHADLLKQWVPPNEAVSLISSFLRWQLRGHSQFPSILSAWLQLMKELATRFDLEKSLQSSYISLREILSSRQRDDFRAMIQSPPTSLWELNDWLSDEVTSRSRPAPEGAKGFCEMVDEGAHAFRELLLHEKNRIVPKGGEGGIQLGAFNSGDCWWRTRFFRNALLLTYYEPTKQKPSDQEAAEMIRKIIFKRGPIEIPGFRNAYEFSLAHEEELSRQLRRWLWRTTLGFGFLRGFHGNSRMRSARIEVSLDRIEKYLSEGHLVYVMLQLKGISTHSALVADLQRGPEESRLFLSIPDLDPDDSLLILRWKKGERTMKSIGGANGWLSSVIPFVQFDHESDELYSKAKNFCAAVN